MTHTAYQSIIDTTARIAWQLDDVLPPDAHLDVNRPLLPESLVDASALPFLAPAERLLLNQIRGRSYTGLFGAMEDVIVPFLDRIAGDLVDESARSRALTQFCDEEAKHTALFERFGAHCARDLGIDHAVFSVDAAQRAVLMTFHPLALALLTLHIEWMTQRHYVDSVRDEADLEPLFAGMLKAHWLEESQHVRIDHLLVDEVAATMTVEERRAALGEYVLMVNAVSAMISVQVGLDLAAFDGAIGRALADDERAYMRKVQSRSFKRAFIGAGVTHPKFLATVDSLAPDGRDILAPLLSRMSA